jgi:hypothetical protein
MAVGTRSNRNGYGAKVEVSAGGVTYSDEIRSGSSYVSASDPRAHFGLGKAQRVDSIVIRWPSGKIDRLGPQTVDKEIVIKEGTAAVLP